MTPRNTSAAPGAAGRFRAAVFDLDGLMIDSESLFFAVAGEFLGRRGHEFSHDLMRRMLGLRSGEGLALMRDEYRLAESIDEIAAESRDLFYDMMPDRLRLMPGLLRLLERVEFAGLPKSVATSSSRHYTERVLGHFGLAARFEFLLTSEDVQRGKPDPQIYRLAAGRFGLAASEVIVFEDSPVGMAAAKAAGCFCVVIPSPYTPDADWSPADLVLPRLDSPRLWEMLAVER